MPTLRTLPALTTALALGAAVTVALSLLALSGAFGPRMTIAGSVFFDACNGRQPDDSCARGSHWASGVAIEYRAVSPLPIFFTTHTDSAGRYRLGLPAGRYLAIIQGCASWPNVSPSPPQIVVSPESVQPGYHWTIGADGTCQVGGIAL